MVPSQRPKRVNHLNTLCIPTTRQTTTSLPPYTFADSVIIVLTYPKKYEKDINLKTWNKEINNFKDANEQDLNGFLLHRMAHYKDSKYDDTALWYCMKEDFVGWTKETWVPMNKDIIREFRNFLREYGVFVPINRGIIRDNIQEHIIDAKEEHEWTPQEIEHQLRTMKKFNLHWNSNTTPQQEQVQDPLTSQFNNLQTLPTRPASPLQPVMQPPPLSSQPQIKSIL